MAAPLDFPNSPTVGQTFGSWVWDGVKWTLGAGGQGMPSGTVMLFFQQAAPSGWNLITTQNDKLLRIVGGTTGGSSGGSAAFSTVNAANIVGTHTLVAGEIPSITFSGNVQLYPVGNSGYYLPMLPNTGWGYTGRASQAPPNFGTINTLYASNYTSVTYTSSFSGNNTLSNGSGAAAAHGHALNLNIAYCDAILCSKS